MSFLDAEELKEIGFKSVGTDVLVSDKAVFYSPETISIGNNVRIDDFCIVSAFGGFVEIGNHIHIAPFCLLSGRGGIILKDYCGLSSKSSVYSANDDYLGEFLVGPVMEESCTNVATGTIMIEKYVTIGTNSAVFPGVTLEEGSILGAFSVATKNLNSWGIYAGIPAKYKKERTKGLLEKVKIMEEKWS